MRLKSTCAAAACSLAFAASAQFAAPLDPDWKEADAPAPPPLRTTGLIELDIPRASLRFGLDPASISIGKDGVVRYVVVAQGTGGTVNGIYEGIHCKTAEARVYARHVPDRGWAPVGESQWRPLHEGVHARYSLAIARGGVCLGHAPNRSAAQIVKDLRAPADSRFATETR